jgi:hypothetical protein
MILQAKENKGVELTGMCAWVREAECARGAGLAGNFNAGTLKPKAVPGTALRNLKGERNSRVRVRTPELLGCLASRRAPCGVLWEGPVPDRRLVRLPSICETPRSYQRASRLFVWASAESSRIRSMASSGLMIDSARRTTSR